MKSFLFRMYGFSGLQEFMEISWLFYRLGSDRHRPGGALRRLGRQILPPPHPFCGQLFSVAGFVCWGLFPHFWGFLLGFVLWGTKSALSSGTFEALICDELKRFGHEADFVKVDGRSLAFCTTSRPYFTVLREGLSYAWRSPAILPC